MRHVAFVAIIATLTAPTLANAGTISGQAALVNRNVLDDMFVQSNQPTVKASAAIDLSSIGLKNCTIDPYVAIGVRTSNGNEFDGGGSCRFNLNERIRTEVSVSHYFLKGESGMTAVIGTVTAGPVDLSVTGYIVDDGLPDAIKLTAGYSITPIKLLTVRGFITYEHGFGVSDVVVGGIQTDYKVANNLFLTGALYTPFHQEDDNGLKAQDRKSVV